jgi:hypothetical protein
MSSMQEKQPPPAYAGGSDWITKVAFLLTLLVAVSLFLVVPATSAAADKRKAQRSSRSKPSRGLTRVELKEAEARLSEMGYGTGRVDGVIDETSRLSVIAFQKWEGRDITGRLSRDDYQAIMNAEPPRAREQNYRHAEVDLDRQVLLLTDDDGNVKRVLPVSSGSNRQYKEKRAKGLAYTPRGRFRIHAKISGWRESPLGLLYYPSYFSGGVAIHGNPSVPTTPESHGCVRVPMSAAVEVSRQLPVGTIVLVYDQRSFVSARDWAEADRVADGNRKPGQQ